MARRDTPEINAGSMADIAFLLLIFFLVTTTMDVDSGIARKLPPMPEENAPPPDDSQINKRNIFIVMVNAKDQLLVNDEVLEISELKEKAKQFIDNNGRLPNLSVNPDKAIISLQNDRGTSYDLYIQVQNELAAAYNELRDALAMSKYGTSYDEIINQDKQKEIRKAYPMRLSEAEPKKQ